MLVFASLAAIGVDVAAPVIVLRTLRWSMCKPNYWAIAGR
jgi:hypothetical protein